MVALVVTVEMLLAAGWRVRLGPEDASHVTIVVLDACMSAKSTLASGGRDAPAPTATVPTSLPFSWIMCWGEVDGRVTRRVPLS